MAPGLVGSHAGRGSGLVWPASVGNKWTEQGLFPQGLPLLGPGNLSSSQALGTLGHCLQPLPGPCFLQGHSCPASALESCPKSVESLARINAKQIRRSPGHVPETRQPHPWDLRGVRDHLLAHLRKPCTHRPSAGLPRALASLLICVSWASVFLFPQYSTLNPWVFYNSAASPYASIYYLWLVLFCVISLTR